MHKLIEYVCDELDEIEKKVAKGSKMSMTDLEYADKLSSLKKNLLKSEMLYDEIMGDEQSGNYPYYMGGSYADGRGGNRGGSRGSNMGGMSNRGGSYARGRGSNARRDSMGRYSSDGGYSRDTDDMVDQLRDLMEYAPDEAIRRDIERLAQKVEKM